VGGVRHVVFSRIREARATELRTLADEVLDWVESYRSPASTRLRVVALKEPPEISPEPAAFLSGDDKRTRVLGSVVHLTLDEGYAELTDPQIAQFAGISTEAFHKQFRSKEECYLAVVDEFTREATASVEAALDGAPTWPVAVHRAVRAFVEHITAHPALLRIAFVDLFEVGSGMIDRMTASVERFTTLLAQSGPEPRRAPEVLPEVLTGAIWDIISGYASNERVRFLPCLTDHIAFVILAPYVGPKGAVDTIEACRYGPRTIPAVSVAGVGCADVKNRSTSPDDAAKSRPAADLAAES
ncbi:MAG TPA: TetR/AcrR family transcriptional regulator, partial [Solirubrobacteraceae bacterium]|nr:TetR/AcrR family transcriptional regulator [Solirubrobacteraceae bacterium]